MGFLNRGFCGCQNLSHRLGLDGKKHGIAGLPDGQGRIAGLDTIGIFKISSSRCIGFGHEKSRCLIQSGLDHPFDERFAHLAATDKTYFKSTVFCHE